MSELPKQFREHTDRGLIRGWCELTMTCEELKLLIGELHERFGLGDSDKVIGELNHRIRQRVEAEMLKVEEANPSFAAWLDDCGRPGDQAPPAP